MCEKGLAEVMIEPQLITDNIKQGSHTYNSNQDLTFNVYWICLKINRFKKKHLRSNKTISQNKVDVFCLLSKCEYQRPIITKSISCCQHI